MLAEVVGVCFREYRCAVVCFAREEGGMLQLASGNTVPPFLVTQSLELQLTTQIAFHFHPVQPAFWFSVIKVFKVYINVFDLGFTPPPPNITFGVSKFAVISMGVL